MTCSDTDEKVVAGTPRDLRTLRLLGYLAQNPAPADIPVDDAQDLRSVIASTADRIIQTFLRTLPSNYVAMTTGPFYSVQFAAIAQALATIQVVASEVYENTDWDFTRPEFLYQTLGVLVFPTQTSDGVPDIDGDITYREFLKKMVGLLLEGSTPDAVRRGASLLAEGTVTLLEKFLDPSGNLTQDLKQQFGYDLLVETYGRTTPSDILSPHYHTVDVSCGGSGTTLRTISLDPSNPPPDHVHDIHGFVLGETEGHQHVLLSAFPTDPFRLQDNVALIQTALKPAHTLYAYSHLFREIVGRYATGLAPIGDETIDTFVPGETVVDSLQEMGLQAFYYEDMRRVCFDAKNIVGSTSVYVPLDRTLLVDPYREFPSPLFDYGHTVTILDGPNRGTYRVMASLGLPFANDPTPVAYTMDPSGVTGTAIVVDGVIVDQGSVDFSTALTDPDETITLATGPNAGTYRVGILVGQGAGPIGIAHGPCGSLKVASCSLRLYPRMPESDSGFAYTMTLNRMGTTTFRTVVDEDVSGQFHL